MRKVPSEHMLSIDRFYSVQWPVILLVNGKCPNQTAQMRMLVLAFAVQHMPEDTFLHGAAQLVVVCNVDDFAAFQHQLSTFLFISNLWGLMLSEKLIET